MKKLLITLLTIVVTHGAFATASNDDATSKLYVDTTVATRQDAVDANTANTVMTYTDTAGTVGTKGIYDATGSYAEQQNTLVSADVANNAIMNAINMEFVCAEWNPAFEEGVDCWKWRIHNTTEHSASRNLFDISTAQIYRSSASGSLSSITKFYPEGTKPDAVTYAIAVIPNTTYTLSKRGGNRLTIGCFKEPTVPGPQDIVPDYTIQGVTDVFDGSYTFTTPSDCVWIVVGLKNQSPDIEDPTDIMLEYGAVATAYEPYQNLHLPVGE